MLKIGLTGGIGSGKSYVAEIFSFLDVPIFYSDLAAKYLMTHDESLKNGIKGLLGKDAYQSDGSMNRKFIAECIFNDPRLLESINGLVHPAVANAAKEWFTAQSTAYAIQESALIFEIGIENNYDKVISVSAPKELRIDRVVKRNHLTKAQVLKRMKQQWSQQKKDDLADWVIINDGERSTIRQVLNIHRALMSN